MKYFVAADGCYLGGFEDVEPPAGAIEIPSPPEHGADIWTGTEWDTTGRPVPQEDVRKEILMVLLDEVKQLRPESGETLQTLTDRLQADEST